MCCCNMGSFVIIFRCVNKLKKGSGDNERMGGVVHHNQNAAVQDGCCSFVCPLGVFNLREDGKGHVFNKFFNVARFQDAVRVDCCHAPADFRQGARIYDIKNIG